MFQQIFNSVISLILLIIKAIFLKTIKNKHVAQSECIHHNHIIETFIRQKAYKRNPLARKELQIERARKPQRRESMGIDHHLDQHHQAADGLMNLFTKANLDLSVVQYRLEKEFQQIYPESVRATRSFSFLPSFFFFFFFILLFSLIEYSNQALISLRMNFQGQK